MPTALVTGGAGFIGSHLVDRLLDEGYAVRVIDNLAVGRYDNIRQHAHHPNFRFYEAGIRTAGVLPGLLQGVDHIYHLAALADIVPSIVAPADYFSTNCSGTVNMLEAARATGIKRFIYVASSSCYGIPDVFPTPETTAIRPEYPYALTKNLGEQCVLHWGKVYGMPVAAVRFFNIYGPRARTAGTYGAVFGVFLSQLAHGQPLTIVGDGTQTRDFTFVSDAVDALRTVADSDAVNEVFNVGSGGTYSVNELADMLGGPRIHIPKRPGEPDCTFADISKISRQLAWQPKMSFRDGVAIMKKQVEAWQGAPVWTKETIETATKDWFTYLSPHTKP